MPPKIDPFKGRTVYLPILFPEKRKGMEILVPRLIEFKYHCCHERIITMSESINSRLTFEPIITHRLNLTPTGKYTQYLLKLGKMGVITSIGSSTVEVEVTELIIQTEEDHFTPKEFKVRNTRGDRFFTNKIDALKYLKERNDDVCRMLRDIINDIINEGTEFVKDEVTKSIEESENYKALRAEAKELVKLIPGSGEINLKLPFGV
jgi:hypothetical protein